MAKFSLDFQKILIISSFSMLLAMIIVSSSSTEYIRRSIAESEFQPQVAVNQPVEEILKPGTIGEASGENSAANAQLPQVITSISGTVKEVGSDRLIIKGDGVNFGDGVSRELNAVFTGQTVAIIAVNQKNITYNAFAGLKYFKAGDAVLVEGAENLRGKIEFRVKAIKIL